ncbi:MAG: hypothetical protein ACYC1I_12925 [Acidimicrobiales bacterium]
MPSEPGLSLATIRVAAKKHADATSLRSAAADIGLSFTGFRAFLAGGKPHPRTRARLVSWYVEHRKSSRRSTRGITRDDAELGICLLGLYLRQDGREDARDRKLIDLARRIAKDGDVSPDLRERLEALSD